MFRCPYLQPVYSVIFLERLKLRSHKEASFFQQNLLFALLRNAVFQSSIYHVYMGGKDEDQAENIGEEESLSNLSNVTGKRAGKCHYNGCVTGIVA